MTQNSCRLAALLASLSLGLSAQDGSRVRAVENGLTPSYQIEGTAPPSWQLADRMKFYKVPALSIAVIHDGKIEWAKGYGVLETGGARAVDANTLFQAASISKPVAALAALALAGKGSLALDQDVNEKLVSWKVPSNEFTGREKVTLKRLLSHTAGTTVHGFPGYAAGAPVPTLVQVLDGVKPANTAPIRVDILPGSQFRYSGGGFTIMQQLLIDVARKPFPEIMKQTVLDPVGMRQSTYQQPLPESLRGNAARGYRPDGQMVGGLWHTYPEMAAAGLWTTPSDLARFALEVRSTARGEGHRVISQSLAKTMLTRQKDDYGLGLSLSGEGAALRFGHGGSNEGYRCQMEMYLESGNGAVVMTDSDSGASLASEVLRSIAAAYGWPGFKLRNIKVTKLDPKSLQKYAGEYKFGGDMKILVSVEGQQLWVTPPDSARVELLPETELRFLLGDENLAELTFTKDERGRITGFDAMGQKATRVQ